MKRLAIIATFIIIAGFQTPQERMVTLQVTEAKFGQILKGVGKLSIEEAGNLYLELQQQYINQTMAPQRPPDTTKTQNTKPKKQ